MSSPPRQACRKGTLDPERIARLEALPGWLWDVEVADWEANFAALEGYVTREGNARVSDTFETAAGRRLGAWVSSQRTVYRKGTLSQDRSDRLVALAGWVWDVDAAAWEDNFAALEAYVAREGHARVPVTFETADGRRLGAWVGTQRTAHQQGTLDSERSARLAALPGWAWDHHEADWAANFAALEAYVTPTTPPSLPAETPSDNQPPVAIP